jgi:hypothetical protein
MQLRRKSQPDSIGNVIKGIGACFSAWVSRPFDCIITKDIGPRFAGSGVPGQEHQGEGHYV